MQAKALVKERAQRNLLLLIDGQKTDEMLLANVAGITPTTSARCESMGLIEPVQAPPSLAQVVRGARRLHPPNRRRRSTMRTSPRRSRSSSPRSWACAASRSRSQSRRPARSRS
jgi:hypothetical protein